MGVWGNLNPLNNVATKSIAELQKEEQEKQKQQKELAKQEPNEPFSLAKQLKNGSQQTSSSTTSVASMESQLKNMLNIGAGSNNDKTNIGSTSSSSSNFPEQSVKLASTNSGSGGPAWGGIGTGLGNNGSSLSIQQIEEEQRQKRTGDTIVTTGWAAKVGGGSSSVSRVASKVSNTPVKSAPSSSRQTSISGNKASQGNSDAKGKTTINGSTVNKNHNPFEAFQDSPIDNDVKDFCLRGLRKLNKGKDSLNLLKYCLTLDDYGEIRQNLYEFLGPNANDFANEFMQKKRELDSRKKKKGGKKKN